MGLDIRYVRVLIRQAKASANPEDTPDAQLASAKTFLSQIITDNFTATKDGQSNLIGSSLNGKTISFQVPDGMSRMDVMLSAETALECLEAGLDGPITTFYAR